jgi:hypothetical protein
MSQTSPLARVKEQFGGKDKLVDKIVGLLDSGDEPKEELRKRLLGAANGKLIRLHEVASSLKQHGGHDKLVEAAAAGLGRSKDKDYVEKLSTFSSGRLLDMLRVSTARGAATAAKAKAAGADKAPAKVAAKKPSKAGKKATTAEESA